MKKIIILYFIVTPWVWLNAQWSANPLINKAVCTADGQQSDIAITSDRSGGAFVVWSDTRSGMPAIYAQHLDSNGATLWAKDGILVRALNGQLAKPVIVADFFGGAIIAWQMYYENGNGIDIYAQRLNSNGTLAWDANGISICNASGDQTDPMIAYDGVSGAFIAWTDNRNGNQDIYIIDITSAGSLRFTTNGLRVCSLNSDEKKPRMISNGYYNVFLTWEDHRNGNADIYAQQINYNGSFEWVSNGIKVCDAADSQYAACIATDGLGACAIAWSSGDSPNTDVYVQKIAADGSVLWANNGVNVVNTVFTADQVLPEIIFSDPSHPTVIWYDNRSGANGIYGQWFGVNGERLWAENGSLIASGEYQNLSIQSDSASGIIATGLINNSSTLYPQAERMDSSGVKLWNRSDFLSTTSAYHQELKTTSDMRRGFIAVWKDNRNLGGDVYAQRVSSSGDLTDGYPVAPIITSVDSSQGLQCTLTWQAPEDQDILRYRIFVGTTVSPTVQWDSADGNNLNKTITHLTAGTRYYVRVAAVDNALQRGDYSTTVTALVLDEEPTVQAISLVYSSRTTSKIIFKVTPASGNPDGYLVVASMYGVFPAFVPQDGMVYTPGNKYEINNSRILNYTPGDATLVDSILSYNARTVYAVYSYNGSGGYINYNTTSPRIDTAYTLTQEPSGNPSSVAFSQITSSSMYLLINNTDAVTGNLVLRRAGSLPTGIPLDGHVYNTGDTIGGDTVINVYSEFYQYGLDSETNYYFACFSYNQGIHYSTINYKTSPTAVFSQQTMPSEPQVAVNELHFTQVGTDSMRCTFAKNPYADGYVVYMRSESPVSLTPQDGETYTVGFGLGDQKIVSLGSDTSFVVRNLMNNLRYYFKIYSYRGAGVLINYNTTTVWAGDHSTLAFAPTEPAGVVLFSDVEADRLHAQVFSPGSGVLVIRKKGSQPNGAPIAGTLYYVNDVIDQDTVVYCNASLSSFTGTWDDDALDASSTYYYAAYAFNGAGQAVNYNQSVRFDSVRTSAPEPAAAAIQLQFTNIGVTGLQLTWSDVLPSDGYLITYRRAISTSSMPTDRTTYYVGATLGNDTVIGITDQKSITVNYLLPGTEYFFNVVAYNGSYGIINYLTSSSLMGSHQTGSDTQTPVISNVNISPGTIGLNYGDSISITCSATDNTVLNDVVLSYRRGGEGVSYSLATSMTHQNSGLFLIKIPPTAIHRNGIQYRIVATDFSQNKDTLYGMIPVIIPDGTVSTNSPGSPYQSGFPDGEWRMISIPLNLNNNKATEVLSALGNPSNNTWRLFDGSNDISDTGRFYIGRSYWLKQINKPGGIQVTLNAGTGATKEQGKIILQPGWNQIGNPFLYTIDWLADTDVSEHPNIRGPIKFDGKKYIGPGQTEGDPSRFTEIAPWNGYWVHNGKATVDTLTIDPTGALSKGLQKNALSHEDWLIQWKAEAGIYSDIYNAIGVAEDASIENDYHDLPELPHIGEYIQVSFKRDEELFTRDIKSPGFDLYEWDMLIQSNVKAARYTLSSQAYEFPSDYVVVVYDVALNKSYALGEKITLQRVDEKKPVQLKVFVGKLERVNDHIQIIQSKIPKRFALVQNYPNPFNPSTRIRFELPKESKITLRIYNTLGQVVRTLAENVLYLPGYWHVMWDGKDERGAIAASGVYFYRLEADGFIATKKMMMIK